MRPATGSVTGRTRFWSYCLTRATSARSPRQAALEAEVHAKGERNVVRGLAIEVEGRGFLEVELAEVVLRHQSNAEVRAELHVDAAAEVVRDVGRVRVEEPGLDLLHFQQILYFSYQVPVLAASVGPYLLPFLAIDAY